MTIPTAYQAVADACGLPRMEPGDLQTSSTVLTDADAAWSALREAQPAAGWLMFQSHQCVFRDGLPGEPAPEWGALLAAEVVVDDDTAIAAQYMGPSGWQVVRRVDQNAGEGLVDEIRLLAHDPGLGGLRYRRYWRLDEDGITWAQAATRLVAIE